MSPATTNNFIRKKYLHPITRQVHAKAKADGYVFNSTSAYLQDFSDIDHCVSQSVLYAQVERSTGNLLKIGFTGNHINRIGLYDNYANYHFLPLANLQLVDKEFDTFLQQKYRQLLSSICNSNTAPSPLKKAFEMLEDRGGELLGPKRNITNQMMETGTQLFYKLGVPAELCMFDESKYKLRDYHATHGSNSILSVIQPVLDLSQNVNIEVVASWNTGFYEPKSENPDGKLINCACFLEYVTGREIMDMGDIDTIPVAAVPHSTTAEEGFSENYSKIQIQQGRERFHNFVRHLKDNSVMLLNTNRILYKGTPHDVLSIVKDHYGFAERLDLWDGECIVLVHVKYKKVILLHRPPGYAGDSRDDIPTWMSVRRILTLEVLKRVLDHLPCAHRDLPQAYGDGIFGSYIFEYMINGLHQNKRVGAAALRDALTPSHVMALQHNGLGKTILDPNYPMSRRLRKEYVNPTNPSRPQNPLFMRRATNLLSYIEDASDSHQVHDVFVQAEILLLQDNPTSSEVLGYRWQSALSHWKEDSPLRQAVQKILKARKSNIGNKSARGHSMDERAALDTVFEDIMVLPLGTSFWIPCTSQLNSVSPPPAVVASKHPVFTMCEATLKSRIRPGSASLKNNTSAKKTTRSTETLKLNRILSNGTSQFMKVDGISFVLCCLVKSTQNEQQLKTEQLNVIQSLPVGTEFWIREKARTSSSQDPTPTSFPSLSFNVPVFEGVKDRLKKQRKSINKVMKGNRPIKSKCGKYLHCKIVTI